MNAYKLHPHIHKAHRHVRQYGLIYGPLALVLIGMLIWYGNSLTWGVSEQNAAPTPPSRVENEAVAEHAQEVPDGLPDSILIAGVPFTSQAPTGKWEDDRFQNGCEEASVLMAARWISGEPIGSAADSERLILELSALANQMFGTYVDSSAADTLKLFQRYTGKQIGTVKYDITIPDIKKELAGGRVIIAPADGQALGNPNFTGAGPERHFLAIIGYDDNTGMFITNDPGTRNGNNYRYKYETLYAALRDYPTGDHAAIAKNRHAIIVIPKG